MKNRSGEKVKLTSIDEMLGVLPAIVITVP